MVETVVKAKVGELEGEVREGFLRRLRDYLNVGVQVISGMKRLLVRFQDSFKKDLTSNQLTVVIVEKIPVEKKPEVPTIPEIPDETVPSEKG